MATHKRGEKVYLDKNTIAEEIQPFMDCRDGIVHVAEFRDHSGYGDQYKSFFCVNCKSELAGLISYRKSKDGWHRCDIDFSDTDTWDILRDLINRKESTYITEVRTY